MTTAVRDNPERERYEIKIDDELAGFAEYRGHGPLRALTHTEIDERFEGRGLASELIGAMLDDLRSQQLHVLPTCPFVKAYLDRHRDYLDLVRPEHRRALNLPEPVPSQ